MLTAAGNLPWLCSKMNGTKKFPHMLTNVKMVMTMMPGNISGATIRRKETSQLAPSTQAACSRSIGTPSMNPFISQIPNGRGGGGQEKDHGWYFVHQVEPGKHAINRYKDGRDQSPAVENTMV